MHLSLRPRLVAALIAALVPATAWGFDPRGIDVLDYRLGMTEPQVFAVLERQGFHQQGFHRKDAACPTDPARRCLTTIEAQTKDGTLTFVFATDAVPPTVTRIVYRLLTRKDGVSEAVEQGTLARFGPPSTLSPMTWCHRVDDAGRCPPDAARLILEPRVGLSRTLILTLP